MVTSITGLVSSFQAAYTLVCMSPLSLRWRKNAGVWDDRTTDGYWRVANLFTITLAHETDWIKHVLFGAESSIWCGRLEAFSLHWKGSVLNSCDEGFVVLYRRGLTVEHFGSSYPASCILMPRGRI